MSTTTPKYPNIKVKFTGSDGNAFAVMGKVRTALRKAKVSEVEINKYIEESMSGNYDHLLATACNWVTISWKNQKNRKSVLLVVRMSRMNRILVPIKNKSMITLMRVTVGVVTIVTHNVYGIFEVSTPGWYGVGFLKHWGKSEVLEKILVPGKFRERKGVTMRVVWPKANFFYTVWIRMSITENLRVSAWTTQWTTAIHSGSATNRSHPSRTLVVQRHH